MIPIEKLQAVKRIIVHGPFCADGRASAMILKQALPYASVEFMNYGDPRHEQMEPEPGLLFCDFSPWLPKPKKPDAMTDEDRGILAKAEVRLQAFVDAGTIVLDHHGTAKHIVERFGELGVFAGEDSEPGVAGAVLAFREVWEPVCRQELGAAVFEAYRPIVRGFAEVAGIRDTWQNKHERFQQGCEQREALLFWDEDELLELPPPSWEEKLEIGGILWNNHLRGIKKFLDRGVRYTSEIGTRVLIAPGLSPTSDAAEMLDSYPPEEQVDLLVGFGYLVDDKDDGQQISLCFSMRSHTGYRCDLFAKSQQGGGHKAAAGFTPIVNPETDLNPYKVFKDTLTAYEVK